MSVFKWENQESNQWPIWFKKAIESGYFVIQGDRLFLITDESGCGGGKYLIEQGDYAVKENDNLYSSRSRCVIESEILKLKQ